MVTCSPVVDGGRWKEGQAEEEELLQLLARTKTSSPSSRTLVYDVETGSLRYSKPCKSRSPRTVLKALDVVDSPCSRIKQLHCEGFFPESSGESSPTCVIQNSALRSNSSSPTMSTISKASSVDPGRRSTGTKPLGVIVATELDSEQDIVNSPGFKSPRLEPHKTGEVRERIKKLESIKNNTSGRPGLTGVTGPRVENEPGVNAGWPSTMSHDQVKDSTLNPPFKSRQCDSKKWKQGRLADSSVMHCKSPGIFSFNATYMMSTSRAPDSDLDSDFHDQIPGETATTVTPKVIQQDLSRRTFLPPLLKPTPSKWDDAEKWLPGSECQSARSKSRSGPLLAQMVAAQAGMSIPWKGQPQIVLSSLTERHHTSGMVMGLQRGEAMEVDSGSETVDIKDVQTPTTMVTTKTNSQPGLEEFTADEKQQLNLLLDRYSVRSGDGATSPSSFNGSFLKLGTAKTEKPLLVVEFSPSPQDEYESEVDLDPVKTNSFTPTRVAVATRDMGTAMTPTASVEPSRTSTPVRATKDSRPHDHHPVLQSAAPGGGDNGDHAEETRTTTTTEETRESPSRVTVMSEKEMQEKTRQEIVALGTQLGKANIAAAWAARDVQQEKEEEEEDIVKRQSSCTAVLDLDNLRRDLFASRADAWQEAEMAKYTARFEQEQAKIQAWEEHEKAKAEADMRRVELKVERMKSQAHEKLAHKLASTRRQAEELRLAAETRRAESAAKAARKAEILKTNGKITNLLFLSYLCT